MDPSAKLSSSVIEGPLPHFGPVIADLEDNTEVDRDTEIYWKVSFVLFPCKFQNIHLVQ